MKKVFFLLIIFVSFSFSFLSPSWGYEDINFPHISVEKWGQVWGEGFVIPSQYCPQLRVVPVGSSVSEEPMQQFVLYSGNREEYFSVAEEGVDLRITPSIEGFLVMWQGVKAFFLPVMPETSILLTNFSGQCLLAVIDNNNNILERFDTALAVEVIENRWWEEGTTPPDDLYLSPTGENPVSNDGKYWTKNGENWEVFISPLGEDVKLSSFYWSEKNQEWVLWGSEEVLSMSFPKNKEIRFVHRGEDLDWAGNKIQYRLSNSAGTVFYFSFFIK